MSFYSAFVDKNMDEKKGGINNEGSNTDFLNYLLCKQLKFMAKTLNYNDFNKLVIPDAKEWFEKHLGEKLCMREF